MHFYWLQWLAAVCLKIDSYDFAKGPLGTKAGAVQADPLITYKGDRDALLILTGGADTQQHKVAKALSLTNWRELQTQHFSRLFLQSRDTNERSKTKKAC